MTCQFSPTSAIVRRYHRGQNIVLNGLDGHWYIDGWEFDAAPNPNLWEEKYALQSYWAAQLSFRSEHAPNMSFIRIIQLFQKGKVSNTIHPDIMDLKFDMVNEFLRNLEAQARRNVESREMELCEEIRNNEYTTVEDIDMIDGIKINNERTPTGPIISTDAEEIMASVIRQLYNVQLG
ncbi:predicted protein [Sclerotinia sclerotiorum 1980 UF-70]|uniref:Uncharacterized protein n=2 Tax=Sclerotinia sclerotiorum (strain ATCC 18683 / 1980 / Ss-1) TaxID=665079 RepID=A7F1H8_SCLS1|nr:predicted protein [Sclerotinia sclerotiorum 1980 UF-70]APA11232.1 hypothetical protein sscle_07g060020 [Sclerotinia sclerotiorum 1980 UF-70]EDN95570.1 predicted protein [Sclerotinia sclerotiorum 1980 UF-70]